MSQTKNYDLVIIFWPTLLGKSLDSCSCMLASCTNSMGVAAVLHQQQLLKSSLAEQLLTRLCFYTSSQLPTRWWFYTSSLWWKRLQSKCKLHSQSGAVKLASWHHTFSTLHHTQQPLTKGEVYYRCDASVQAWQPQTGNVFTLWLKPFPSKWWGVKLHHLVGSCDEV